MRITIHNAETGYRVILDAVKRRARWLLPLAALAIMLGLMSSAFLTLRRSVWCYLTDDISIHQEANTGERFVLAEAPYQTLGDFNVPSDVAEPAFSADETLMVFTRGRQTESNADLFVSTWNGISWGEALPLESLNTESNEVSLAMSRDGKYVYFASDRPGGYGGLDIWMAVWDGANWAGVTNLGPSVNSPADETGPAMSPDGKRLYFTSNRPLLDKGLLGQVKRNVGFDIFSADVVSYLEPAVLTGKVVAVLAPDGQSPPATGKAAGKVAGGSGKKASASAQETTGRDRRRVGNNILVYATLPPVPVFGNVGRVDALNSEDDDVHPVVTARGDYLYFASNRRGGLGGFDIYAGRIVNGVILKPENLGSEINTSGDDTTPAIRMEGFDIMFCSNHGQRDRSKYMMYSATTREIIGRVDTSRWQDLMAMLDKIKWWILAFIACLALLLYLIKEYKHLTNRFHQCLMASAMFHLAIIVGLSFWTISKALATMEDPNKFAEIMMDPNDLAQVRLGLDQGKEHLSLDMNDKVTELPACPVTVIAKHLEEDLAVPDYTPTEPPKTALGVVTKSADHSFVSRITPSAESRVEKEVQVAMVAPAKELQKLPEMVTEVTDVTMEERAAPVPETTPDFATTQVKPAKTVASEQTFDPRVIQRDVEMIFKKNDKVATVPVSKPAKPEDTMSETGDATASKANIRDTGGSVVAASAGVETRGHTLPEMKGAGDVVSLLIKSSGSGKHLRLWAPGPLEVPGGDPNGASILGKPRGKLTGEMVEELGGDGNTQGAAEKALNWFVKNQEADGRWAINKFGGQAGHDVGASGLALLCFFSWGANHIEPGPYQETVKKGLEWLLGTMKGKGDLCTGNGNNGMYDQGMATMALCEAYGSTKDPKLLEPCSNAVYFIVAAQDKQLGGWRYQPRSGSDLSVFGWQFMALKSAELTGIPIPKETLDLAEKYVTSSGGGESGGIYGYQGPASDREAMVATGMFCRQLTKHRPTNPRMKESATFIHMRPLDSRAVNFYYLYYATLCLYQHQGEMWERWNKRMKESLTALQCKTGDNEGSWDPSGAGHGNEMGRVVTTALATLSLEVYYRLLPIYGMRDAGE